MASHLSTFKNSKSRANPPRTAIASAISTAAEKLGVRDQHLGAAPKEKARDRTGGCLALCGALDNESIAVMSDADEEAMAINFLAIRHRTR